MHFPNRFNIGENKLVGYGVTLLEYSLNHITLLVVVMTIFCQTVCACK